MESRNLPSGGGTIALGQVADHDQQARCDRGRVRCTRDSRGMAASEIRRILEVMKYRSGGVLAISSRGSS